MKQKTQSPLDDSLLHSRGNLFRNLRNERDLRSNLHTNIFTDYSEGEKRGKGETSKLNILKGFLSRGVSQQCLLCF